MFNLQLIFFICQEILSFPQEINTGQCPKKIMEIPPLLEIPLNCVQYNLKGNPCANYISIYLENYAGIVQSKSEVFSDTPTQGYSPSVPPQDTFFFPVDYFNLKETASKEVFINELTENSTATTLQVYLGLELLKMFGIDDATSTLKAKVIFAIQWIDPRLTWNYTKTPLNPNYCANTSRIVDQFASLYFNSYSVQLKRETVWTPDVLLLNSVSDSGQFLENMAGSKHINLASMGLVTWRLQGTIESFCDLNLHWFPFDFQTCSFHFSDRSNYILGGLNFTFVPTNINDTYFSSQFVDSISWTTQSVTVSREESILFGDAFQRTQSILTYTIVLQRNAKVYFINAIIPNILITMLSVVSLWISDYPTRLALDVTALLALMAVLWSVSSTLPHTLTFTWMDIFVTMNIVTITLIIFETCVVFYLTSKKHIPPQWYSSKVFVYITKWSNLMHMFCCCFYSKKKNSKDLEENIKINEIETSTSLYINSDQVKTEFEIIRESSIRDSKNITNKDSKVSFNENAPVNKPKYSVLHSTQENITNLFQSINASKDFTYSSTKPLSDTTLTWTSLAKAIDIFFQITFTIAYVLGTLLLFITPPN